MLTPYQFMLHLIKVHAIKPNYQAIAASMGDGKLPSRLTVSTLTDKSFQISPTALSAIDLMLFA